MLKLKTTLMTTMTPTRLHLATAMQTKKQTPK
jgi:hypothetical protein